jgi:hypothetical protein
MDKQGGNDLFDTFEGNRVVVVDKVQRRCVHFLVSFCHELRGSWQRPDRLYVIWVVELCNHRDSECEYANFRVGMTNAYIRGSLR